MPCETAKVPLPKEHKAAVCIWDDLDVTATAAILGAAGDKEEIKRHLVEIFGLGDHKENSRSAILLDLHYFTIQFAIEKGFNKEQTSTFFSIVKKTHEVCVETPFGNLEQSFDYFKELVLCHAVKRPPWSIHLFSPEEVKAITEYVVNTYFRHFKLYKYAFTPVVRLDLSMTYVGLPETPEPEEEAPEEALDEETAVAEDEAAAKEAEEENGEKQEEESPAHQELRRIITAHLTEEISKLRTSLDEQMKLNDESIKQKLNAVGGVANGKPAKESARGKKK